MFKVRNLLSISQLDIADVDLILSRASYYAKHRSSNVLNGALLINFFFEHSTRTRLSFEIAAKRLGAAVVNISSDASSVKKGEDFISSIDTLMAYSPNYIVIRHPESGVLNQIAHLPGIINAGDGLREHPSQALGDVFTIIQNKGYVAGLKVAICGDVMNSRAAKSDIALLTLLGAHVRIVTVPFLVFPQDIPVYHNMEEGLQDVDVVIFCRYKQEYMRESNDDKLYMHYKISNHFLSYANPGVLVMHAGPVIKDVDIDRDVLSTAINSQVENCLYVRQAILELMHQ